MGADEAQRDAGGEAGVPGPGGSVFKLHYSEARHKMGDLAMRIIERDSVSLEPSQFEEHVRGWMHAMSITIAAGTSQIQRNIVGERVLGLPKG